MTKVKICGITNFPDAVNAMDSGADAIGFNFYKDSKRYISSQEAESIVERLEKPIIKVGVFVNESIEKIIDAEALAELDAIQLHGDESPAFVAQLRAGTNSAIIKALRVTPGFSPRDVLEYEADAILLDHYSPLERGGTGNTVNFDIARSVSNVVDVLYLAGGLSPANVEDAIRMVGPYAVDACSCLETSPGIKDHEKVAAFVKAAKEGI